MNRSVGLGATVLWLCIIIITALLEATWLQALSIQQVIPDIILVLVVYFSIGEGTVRGMYTGCLGGIFQDVAADTGVGHHALCLVLIAYVIGRLAARLITDNPYVKTMTVLLASIVQGILYLMIEYVQKVDLDALYTMSYSIMPQAFYTACATPFIFYVLTKLRGESFQGDFQ